MQFKKAGPEVFRPWARLWNLSWDILHRPFDSHGFSPRNEILPLHFSGKVHQSAGNSRRFPLENIDLPPFSLFFPGKVNQISTNLRHFPRPLPHTLFSATRPRLLRNRQKGKSKIEQVYFHYSRLRYIFAFGRNTVAPRQSNLNKFICSALGFCVYLKYIFCSQLI